MIDQIEVREINLKIEEIGAQLGVSTKSMRLTRTQDHDFLRDQVIYGLVRRVATWQPAAELTVPEDWWQAWKNAHKDRWYGRWIARRWPPRMMTFRPALYLPEFPIPEDRVGGVTVAYWRDPLFEDRPGPDWGDR